MRRPLSMFRARRRSVVLGAAAVGVLVAGACSEQAAAVRVGDDTISTAQFMDEVDDLYEWANGEPAAGAYDQELVGGFATERAVFLILKDLYEAEGPSLTQEEVDGVCASMIQLVEAPAQPDSCQAMLFELGGSLSAPPDWYVEYAVSTMGPEVQNQLIVDDPAPEWYQDQIIDQIVMNQLLNQELGPGYLQGALAEADVEVSSRFGSWDGDLLQDPSATSAVVPPVGPLVQQDGEEPDLGELDLGDLDVGEINPEDIPVEEAPAGP